MKLKNFKITDWRTHPCPMGTVEVPKEFEAEIEGKGTLEEIVREVKNNLVGKKATEKSWYWPAWEGDYVRIPYGNIVTEEKGENGVAAFVLVAEIFGNTTAIKEGIYGIKKQGRKLKGKLVTYDYTYFTGTNNPNYFRHMVDKIENGILKYRRVTDGPEYECDLNEL